ncbi:MAG: tryptophan--tRNA ligase, partial [Caldilineaceae bacterium]
KLTIALNNFLEPMRERRAKYEEDRGYVDHLLVTGTERARLEAQETLREVKKAMGLTGVWNSIRRSDEKREKKLAKEGA